MCVWVDALSLTGLASRTGQQIGVRARKEEEDAMREKDRQKEKVKEGKECARAAEYSRVRAWEKKGKRQIE